MSLCTSNLALKTHHSHASLSVSRIFYSQCVLAMFPWPYVLPKDCLTLPSIVTACTRPYYSLIPGSPMFRRAKRCEYNCFKTSGPLLHHIYVTYIFVFKTPQTPPPLPQGDVPELPDGCPLFESGSEEEVRIHRWMCKCKPSITGCMPFGLLEQLLGSLL